MKSKVGKPRGRNGGRKPQPRIYRQVLELPLKWLKDHPEVNTIAQAMEFIRQLKRG